MPQFKKVTIMVDSEQREFSPAQNGDVSVWVEPGDSLSANSTLTYARRQSTGNQATRKASLKFTTPLMTTCAETCKVESRGVILFTLDNVVSKDATEAERVLAYDSLLQLLADADVRDAFINNGSFYS